MDWNGWEINPDRPYNVSHITENGLVVVQNGFLSSDFAKLTLEDAKLLFEKIGESNLYGFKVGDMVCPEYVRGVRQTEKTCYYLNKILVNAAGKAFGFFTKDNNNDAKKFDSYCELSKLQKQGGSVQ
jgi:predicted nucleic acid-binding Zn finger protein